MGTLLCEETHLKCTTTTTTQYGWRNVHAWLRAFRGRRRRTRERKFSAVCDSFTREREKHESILRFKTLKRSPIRTVRANRHRVERRFVPENRGEFQTVMHRRERVRVQRKSIPSSDTELHVPRRRF